MSYTFHSVYVDNVFCCNYCVNIKDVISCEYDNFAYIVDYGWGCVGVNVKPIKSFEDMFPIFPYDKNKLNVNKIDNIEKRVDKMENYIAKLLSHVEAIMTVLKQRLPTDELLTL